MPPEPAPLTAKERRERRQRFEAALMDVITYTDHCKVIEALLLAAKRGESWAITAYLDRVLGKPTQPVAIDADHMAPLVVSIPIEAVLDTPSPAPSPPQLTEGEGGPSPSLQT